MMSVRKRAKPRNSMSHMSRIMQTVKMPQKIRGDLSSTERAHPNNTNPKPDSAIP